MTLSPAKNSPQAVQVASIGLVESEFRIPSQVCEYGREVRIRVDSRLEPGLTGLEYFSHLWVIYQQHRSDEWLQEKGWGTAAPLMLPVSDDRSGQGVFSSRAPCRPAALGSCIVQLVRREGAVLIVRGLDAFDGTPVLDLKPYVPQFDAFPQAVVPLHWARVMDRDDDATRASREFHWDLTNVEFALGLRAGTIVLGSIGNKRRGAFCAEICAGFYFAQGWEAATGCSPLRGTLHLKTRDPEDAPWSVSLDHEGRRLAFEIPRTIWDDAASVLSAKTEELVLPANQI